MLRFMHVVCALMALVMVAMACDGEYEYTVSVVRESEAGGVILSSSESPDSSIRSTNVHVQGGDRFCFQATRTCPSSNRVSNIDISELSVSDSGLEFAAGEMTGVCFGDESALNSPLVFCAMLPVNVLPRGESTISLKPASPSGPERLLLVVDFDLAKPESDPVPGICCGRAQGFLGPPECSISKVDRETGCPTGVCCDINPARCIEACDEAPRNEWGCPECLCPEACSELSCDLACDNGFKTDENGCDICECKESEVCPDVICPMAEACEGGLDRDDKGCEICSCKCTEVACEMACAFGFAENDEGCEVCACRENPCLAGGDNRENDCDKQCENGYKEVEGCQVCECREVKPAECSDAACNFLVPCAHGQKLDAEGCQLCECCEEVNTARCGEYCKEDDRVYFDTESGCPSCECREPCPLVRCSTECPNGYKYSEGCQTCECAAASDDRCEIEDSRSLGVCADCNGESGCMICLSDLRAKCVSSADECAAGTVVSNCVNIEAEVPGVKIIVRVTLADVNRFLELADRWLDDLCDNFSLDRARFLILEFLNSSRTRQSAGDLDVVLYITESSGQTAEQIAGMLFSAPSDGLADVGISSVSYPEEIASAAASIKPFYIF